LAEREFRIAGQHSGILQSAANVQAALGDVKEKARAWPANGHFCLHKPSEMSGFIGCQHHFHCFEKSNVATQLKAIVLWCLSHKILNRRAHTLNGNQAKRAGSRTGSRKKKRKITPRSNEELWRAGELKWKQLQRRVKFPIGTYVAVDADQGVLGSGRSQEEMYGNVAGKMLRQAYIHRVGGPERKTVALQRKFVGARRRTTGLGREPPGRNTTTPPFFHAGNQDIRPYVYVQVQAATAAPAPSGARRARKALVDTGAEVNYITPAISSVRGGDVIVNGKRTHFYRGYVHYGGLRTLVDAAIAPSIIGMPVLGRYNYTQIAVGSPAMAGGPNTTNITACQMVPGGNSVNT
jgi:hypothetical protein